MKKRDDGFLRYEVRLVRMNGTTKVLEREATAHRCNIIQRRFDKTVRLGRDDGATLRFSNTKIAKNI